jgi:hypothetical protein
LREVAVGQGLDRGPASVRQTAICTAGPGGASSLGAALRIDATSPAVTALRDLNKSFANWIDLAFQKPLLHAAVT